MESKRSYSFKLIPAVLVLLSYATVTKAATTFDVAHAAIHRMERLIDLGKIAPEYSTNFKGLTLEKLNPNTEPDRASFRSTIQQVANSNGTAKKLEIRLDVDGKSLADKELPGSEATNVPQWPDKSASELVEESMHHVLHLNDPSYAPFINGLSALSLSSKGVEMDLRAVVSISAVGNTSTLVVTIKPNGELDSIIVK